MKKSLPAKPVITRWVSELHPHGVEFIKLLDETLGKEEHTCFIEKEKRMPIGKVFAKLDDFETDSQGRRLVSLQYSPDLNAYDGNAAVQELLAGTKVPWNSGKTVEAMRGYTKSFTQVNLSGKQFVIYSITRTNPKFAPSYEMVFYHLEKGKEANQKIIRNKPVCRINIGYRRQDPGDEGMPKKIMLIDVKNKPGFPMGLKKAIAKYFFQKRFFVKPTENTPQQQLE